MHPNLSGLHHIGAIRIYKVISRLIIRNGKFTGKISAPPEADLMEDVDDWGDDNDDALLIAATQVINGWMT
jgi:hypothetical protein